MLTQMIAEMYSRAGSPRVVPKCHAWVIHLMYHIVKLIFLTQCCELKLTSPHSIFLNIAQVLVKSLIILNESGEKVWVLLHVGHSLLSILLV